MGNNIKRFLSLALALVMVFTMLPGTVFAAGTGVTTEAALINALAEGGEVSLGGDIALTAMLEVPSGVTATLDLNGYDITVPEVAEGERHIYALNNKGVLTLKDSSAEGTGSISARGIYNGYDGSNTSNTVEGAKMTIESGTYIGMDANGGAPIFNCAEIIINGGTFEGKAAAFNNRAKGDATINGGTFRSGDYVGSGVPYAIQNNGGVMLITYATVDAGFGAVGQWGGTTTIFDGDFQPTGTKGTTCNVVYVGSGDMIIMDGTFAMNYPADAVPDSGAAVVAGGSNSLTIADGTFIGVNGAVSGNSNTTITGGNFGTAFGYDAWDNSANYVPEENKDDIVFVSYEAKSDEAYYETLADAVAAGGEVMLLKNTVLSETITVAEGNTVVLDLNGKNLSTENETTSYAINNQGKLTLKDTKGTGSISARGIYNGYDAEGNYVTDAELTVESGTYNAKGTDGGAAIFNYGIANINGGKFTSVGSYSLNNRNTMTVDGATATGGIYNSGATLTIEDGDISNSRSGAHTIYAWNSNVTINDGTIHNENSGNATVYAGGTSVVDINGGTFTIKIVDASSSYLIDAQNTAVYTIDGGDFTGGIRANGTSMTITDGTFTNPYGNYTVNNTTISGGSFTGSFAKDFASKNLAEGFMIDAGFEEDEWTVIKDDVAKIGDEIFESLQAAIEAVQDGETITLLRDYTFTEGANGSTNGISYTRDASFTLDLNGKTITSDLGNNALRFKIGDGTEVSKPVTITIKNGKIVSGANNWCAISAASTDAAWPLTMNLEDLTVEANKANDYAIKSWGNATVNADNVTVNGNYAGGFYAVGGEMVLDNCEVNQIGLHTAPYNSMAFAVSNGGKLTVNSGDYSTEPKAATDANNQGSSHGSWVGGVMNSGGTLIINGGTFANGNYGEDSLATAARGMFLADTGAVLEITGGEFNALKGVIDYTNNLGDASKNPVVTISGGTYTANPGEQYLAKGFIVDAGSADGEWTVKVAPPSGTITVGYTSASDIWGEASTNAKESLVIEIYEGETKAATTTLNNIGGIIDGDVTVTWHNNFVGNFDEYWTTTWEAGYPNAGMQLDKVVLYVDGVKVHENVVQLNGPDGINKVVATAEKNGEFLGYFKTLTEAMGKFNGRTVYVLRDVTEDISGFYGVTLKTNVEGGVTITDTNDDWVDFDDVVLGKGVTAVIENPYSGDSENTILGTLEVAGTYYHGYDAKTTIKDGGKVIVDGPWATTILRYNKNQDSGIYIYGDGNDETVEFKCSYYIGAYSGTFYAEDANIEAGYYLLKNSYDNENYAGIELELNNSELKTVGTPEDGQCQFTSDDDASITLTNGSSLNVKGVYTTTETVEVSMDETSSIAASNYAMVATYDELIAALAAGKQAVLTTDITAGGVIDAKNAIIDLNGKTLTLADNANNNFLGTSTIKNGTLSIDGVEVGGDCIIGIGDRSNDATLNLIDVDLVGSDYSSAFAVLMIYGNGTLNITGGEWNLSNEKGSAGGVIKNESGAGSEGTLNITGTTMVMDDITRGISGTTAVLDDVTMTITGGDNGINGAALTVKNSTLNISGGAGRALTVTNNDVTVENSTLNFSDNAEADILFKTGNTLTVDENSTLNECNTHANAEGAMVNDRAITGTEDDQSTVSVIGGVTTVNNPWVEESLEIDSIDDLWAFAAAVNAGNTYAGKTVTLYADIDLEDADWAPIGTASNPFLGSFNGNDHTISNIWVDSDFYSAGNAGFFGYIGTWGTKAGTVQNLNLENVTALCTQSSAGNVGTLAGYANANISNITVNTGAISGRVEVGGLVGNATLSTIKDCTVIDVTINVGYGRAGGITGQGYCTIDNCYVDIEMSAGWAAGGIIGLCNGCTITNNYVTGTLTESANYGDAYKIGGIVGTLNETAKQNISNNYCDAVVDTYDHSTIKFFPVIGMDNTGGMAAETAESLSTNSWNREKMDTDTLAVNGNDDVVIERNNNLIMLESDIQYMDAKDVNDVTKMSFSKVTDEQIAAQVRENNREVGDVNGDYDISNADVVIIARYLVNLAELTEYERQFADVNGDGQIRNNDLVILVRRLVEADRG